MKKLFVLIIVTFFVFIPTVSAEIWNKNPYFNNYNGVDVHYTDTTRGYQDFDWYLDWYCWTGPPEYWHREGRGWGLWSSDGKLTLDAYFDSNDPAWSFGGASVAFARQNTADAPWGSYPGLTRFRVGDYPYSEIKGKYKLNRIGGLGAIENGIVNIWFEVDSTYKGVTKKRIVGVDYYWYNPLGIYNDRVDDEETLHISMFAPNHWNGHNNWRSFPPYRYLYLIGMNAEIEGERFGFYFDWENLELVMIDYVAEVVPISPVGSGEIEITTDYFYVEKASKLPRRGGGGGCGGSPMNRCIHLGDYEFPFYILIIPVVIIVAIFGVFKFFAKRIYN